MATAFDMQASLAQAKEAYNEGIGSLHGYADSSRNFILQSALTDQANAHEIEMWEKQNAYNTPAAQMERLKDAGLNPMLAYTQGSPGNATSAPGTHVPNAKLTRDQDNLQKVGTIIQSFQAVNGMVQDILGTIEQSYDLGIKRNEKAWSDLDFAAAKNAFAGFGRGRHTDPRMRITSVTDPDGNTTTNLQSALDPYSENFSPQLFRVLDRLGVSAFVPKQTTAQAGALYSGSRTNYQNYYNENILPLLKEFEQGKVDTQAVHKRMIDYQDKVMEMIPPEFRAWLVPILMYLRPLINTSLRNY